MTPTAANQNTSRTHIAYGAKYDRATDIAEIAKRVRADLKAAVKAKDIPGTKYRVTIERYSQGQSLNVRIGDVPFTIVSEERIRRDILDRADFDPAFGWRTEEAVALIRKVEAIVGAYNFDGSDSQTDYYHVNFYSTVDYGRQENTEGEAFRAKYTALRDAASRTEWAARATLLIDSDNARREHRHDAIHRRAACPAAWAHDGAAGCGLCEGL
jgi:hypothetical protein